MARTGKAHYSGVAGRCLRDFSDAERRDDRQDRGSSAQSRVERIITAHLGKKPFNDVHIVRVLKVSRA